MEYKIIEGSKQKFENLINGLLKDNRNLEWLPCGNIISILNQKGEIVYSQLFVKKIK
jgi:hypothetical protein